MKTIWMLNHYAGAMFEDLGGRHHWFAKELAKRGYKTVIFCANTRYGRLGCYIKMDGNRYIKKTSADGIDYVFVKCSEYMTNGYKRIKNMIDFMVGVKHAMIKFAKEVGRPDVILASSVHPLTLIAGEDIARRWSIPCICEVRDLWPEALFYSGKIEEHSVIGQILTHGEHWIYNRANAIVFLKPGDPLYIKEKGWDIDSGGCIDYGACYYINNGVDLESFDNHVKSDKVTDIDFNNDSKLFIYTGTINMTNAVGNLVDAAIVLRNRTDIKILVYGSGVDLESLRTKVDTLGLTNIVFKGFIPKQSIPYVLTNARATILNYSAKGYNWTRGNSSNKLFEYLAAGKPIISNLDMGYNIIDTEHCGITLDKDDPYTLARAIESIADMPPHEYESMCRRSRHAVLEYDFSKLTDKLELVIKSVLRQIQ